MRWEDERYVRLYTRDTVEDDMLPWESRALWPLVLRKVDRAGIMELGKHGARGLAAAVKLPLEVVEPGLAGLIEDGRVQRQGTTLVVPNFIEAQETPQSDAARKRASREKARASVTNRDTESQNVTESHAESREVTNGHSVPFCAVPSSPSEGEASASPAQGGFQFDEHETEDPGDSAQREMAEAVMHYKRRWVEVFKPADGVPPSLTKSDRSQLRSMLKAHGLETWKKYLERFLSDLDRKLITDGHALALMPRRLNGYRSTAVPQSVGRVDQVRPRPPPVADALRAVYGDEAEGDA